MKANKENIKYHFKDLLFPQNIYKYYATINKDTWIWLQKEAIQMLKNEADGKVDYYACQSVKEHWGKIAAGILPEGFRISEY